LLLFLLLITLINYFLLCQEGQGLYYIHYATGERVHLDFSPFFFLLLRGKGVEVNVFFFPIYMKRWKEEGGKGYIGFF